MVTRTRGDTGFSLTEMLVVVALLGVVIAVVFTTVQVLSGSAQSTTTNGNAANNMSLTMELISKSIMGGRVLYASDQRIVILTRDASGYQLQSIYTTAAPGPAMTTDRLVWERWSCDASATAPVPGTHVVSVMSESNANLFTDPPTSLFAYYKDATDAGLLSKSAPDMSSAPDFSLAAFTGPLAGGYTVSVIGRVRLRVAARFQAGIQDNFRDIVLRVRG